MGRQLKLIRRETSSQFQQMSIRQTRQEWKAFKLVILEEKSLSLKELAALFLTGEAKCVTFPNIKLLLTNAMVLSVSTAIVDCSLV